MNPAMIYGPGGAVDVRALLADGGALDGGEGDYAVAEPCATLQIFSGFARAKSEANAHGSSPKYKETKP